MPFLSSLGNLLWNACIILFKKKKKKKKKKTLLTILRYHAYFWLGVHSLNSQDLFLNLRRRVKITKPLRFENKSLRLKYKCLICIWIIFWAILDLFINHKYLFQNKSFSPTYYFKSEKSFVILTSLLGLKNKSRDVVPLKAFYFDFVCWQTLIPLFGNKITCFGSIMKRQF